MCIAPSYQIKVHQSINLKYYKHYIIHYGDEVQTLSALVPWSAAGKRLQKRPTMVCRPTSQFCSYLYLYVEVI